MSAASEKSAQALALMDDQALAAEAGRIREKLFRQLEALCGSAWEGQPTPLDDTTLARIRIELGEKPGEDE